jgi:hypothetical protein
MKIYFRVLFDWPGEASEKCWEEMGNANNSQATQGF